MITYHHIGGRNGTYPLPLKKGLLLNDFHLILYDADDNCLDQMKIAGHEAWGKVSVFPYCIGGKSGKGNFNLNFHPTNNSLYDFNPEFAEYNFISNPLYGEYIFGEACKHMRSVELDLFSLPDVLNSSGILTADFLSLDVQGAEYDILNGAQELLKNNCVGVHLEAEFVKLYKDQKTFSDINSLMESLGFELLELDSFGRCAPISVPIGFRGLEQPIHAEATYIKSVDNLAKTGNIELLYKGALFSLMYKKLGMCFKFLTKISQLAGQQKGVKDINAPYIQCLNEIWDLFQASRNIKMPRLSQLFSHERFQNFYAQKKGAVDLSFEQKIIIDNMQSLLPTIEQLAQQNYSALEMVLQRYGMDDVAQVVKEKRLFESLCFSQALDKLLEPVA